MTAIRTLEDIVEDVLRERFDDVDIDDIQVRRDEDHDGDPILRITVVYNTKNKKGLDARKTSSIVRVMRPHLDQVNENAFPVVSFVSRSDWKGGPAATG
jgi:hypothetical protein